MPTLPVLALLDLSDLRAVLNFLTSDEGKDDLKGIGGASTASVGVILRKISETLCPRRGHILRRTRVRHC